MGAQIMQAVRSESALERRPFVASLLALVPDALVVTGLGSPAYDVFAAGDREKNYYLWGAMGGAASMGLGLALARPQNSVLVITGDGEMLMGIGSLATIGAKQPPNLTILVLDNGHFGETGMQRSHSSLGTQLVEVAKGFGIANAQQVQNDATIAEIAQTIKKRESTYFVQALIAAKEPPRALPPRDGPYIKNRFRSALGLKPF
jgi:thiamine pyrophosphate-dependent acetolactate synthase large subunit-like protein